MDGRIFLAAPIVALLNATRPQTPQTALLKVVGHAHRRKGNYFPKRDSLVAIEYRRVHWRLCVN